MITRKDIAIIQYTGFGFVTIRAALHLEEEIRISKIDIENSPTIDLVKNAKRKLRDQLMYRAHGDIENILCRLRDQIHGNNQVVASKTCSELIDMFAQAMAEEPAQRPAGPDAQDG